MTVLHHVREEDVTVLETIFAVLTPQGWAIPDWIVLMRKTIRPELSMLSLLYCR